MNLSLIFFFWLTLSCGLQTKITSSLYRASKYHFAVKSLRLKQSKKLGLLMTDVVQSVSNHQIFDTTMEVINESNINTDEVDQDNSFMGIPERTIACLDFNLILDSVQSAAKTILGKQIASHQYSYDLDNITRSYAMVDDIGSLIDILPLRSTLNVNPVLSAIENNTSPPTKEELAIFASDIEQINDLYKFYVEQEQNLQLFVNLFDKMSLSDALLEMFINSFDEDGNLNPDKFPIIKELKSSIGSLRGRIVQTIQSLLQSSEMREKLADSGYSEIDGRYCLLLRNTYKRGVGIVHGSSNTGRTIYVEPMELVEPTNELRSLQAQLKAEESKIFFAMCKSISTHRNAIRLSVKAIAMVDVFMAKAKFGQMIKGTIPEVGKEGVIHCIDAKHPILMMRASTDATKKEVLGREQSFFPLDTNGYSSNSFNKRKTVDIFSSIIGNPIDLSETSSSLVISGPNAGGKTIILKTCGLFALMVTHGIPISARVGARVDVFQVMADIGDIQSVSGDLSTFSGHLVICREILSKVKSYKGNSIVLLDEIGTGTDPAQGAALAQAILEELIDHTGTRVMVTTHYQRIKELAAHDPRFNIAAMEFIQNKPTYRLKTGLVGESYALEAARRMNLPESVLIRADALLDDESRRLVALQKKLEEETEKAYLLQQELQSQIDDLEGREALLQSAKSKLEAQIQKLRENKTDEFLSDLKSKEKELEELIIKVKELAFQQSQYSGAGSGSSSRLLATDIDQGTGLSKQEKISMIEETKTTVN
eukprot:gene12193-16336_t